LCGQDKDIEDIPFDLLQETLPQQCSVVVMFLFVRVLVLNSIPNLNLLYWLHDFANKIIVFLNEGR